MRIEVPFLPDSEGVEYGTVATWPHELGAQITKDDVLVEVEAEKVLIEIPAPATGTLVEIVAEEGDEVGVGAVLAVIEDGQS